MFSFCSFYIFFVQKIFIVFVSVYKGVVGFLPVPTCKILTFFKILSILQ